LFYLILAITIKNKQTKKKKKKKKKDKIYGKNITLNVVAYATEDYSNIYKTMINDFNEYSIKKELDIYVDLTVISNSDSYESYASMVQALLMKKNNNKYDLYYYDNAYTQEYGPYLLDLEKYLPKDHIDMFNSKLLSQSCIYENKLVGLVNIKYILYIVFKFFIQYIYLFFKFLMKIVK